jgi:hypothetical protein
VVTQFYAKSGAFRDADTGLLSSELRFLVASARDFERRDAERTRLGPNPTDKPMLIEGDVFTSLYEGHEAFLIEEVTLKADRAVVKVNFSNLSYKQRWQDEVHLLREGGWKIDNVYFGSRPGSASSTSQILKDFLVSDVLPTPGGTGQRIAP